MRLSDLETPVLTAEFDAVDRNIAAIQRYCDEHGLALRPHIKTHKLPEIACLQRAAGAKGIKPPISELDMFPLTDWGWVLSTVGIHLSVIVVHRGLSSRVERQGGTDQSAGASRLR